MTTRKNRKSKYLKWLIIVGLIVLFSTIVFIINSRVQNSNTNEKVYELANISSDMSELMQNSPSNEDFLTINKLDSGSRGYQGPEGETYIVTKTNIPIGKTLITQSDSNIKVIGRNDSLLPYVNNNLYCQTDKDCFNRFIFCRPGLTNGFSPIVLFGCGTAEPDSSLTESELRSCPSYKAFPNTSTAKIKYSKIVCQNQVCAGIERQVYCERENQE
jgi:hypothetical protein